MFGLRLLEMEACDALDVIHVLLEEDSTHVGESHRESKRHVRSVLYGDIYGLPVEEAVQVPPRASSTADGRIPPVKDYIPPTDPETLQSIVGPPVG